MKYRTLSNIFIILSFIATIMSFLLIFVSSIKYGGRNYYGDLGFIIAMIGSIPFVISIVIITIRYQDATVKYSKWLERNKLLIFFVFLPLFIVSVLLIRNFIF